MSRHDYPLRDETVKTLTGNCPAIADAWGVSPQYVYGILEGNNPDPFSYYLEAHKAAVGAGVSTEHWDAKLASVKARAVIDTPQITESHCLSELINRSAKTQQHIVMALEDGVIEEHEAREIRRASVKLRDTLDCLDAKLAGPERRENAKKVVEARFRK